MTKMLNTLVISVDYRLAPEVKYPGGLEDVERALNHLVNNAATFGVNPKKIVLMGDSAGGNLVAAVTQRLRSKNDIQLAGQVLLYPLLQFHNLQTESFRHYHRDLSGLALVDPFSLAFYYMWYAGVDVNEHPELALAAVTNGHVSPHVYETVGDLINFTSIPTSLRHENLPSLWDVKENSKAMKLMEERLLDPSFAPLVERNLTGLPPSFVMTCQYDILRDEGVLYAQRMREAGVTVEWKHYENGFHAMLNFHNELYIAQESLTDVVNWVGQRFRTL
jgi:acetyl esterase/lipase